MFTRTDSLLRLHTDSSGKVWFGGDDVPAENSGLDPYAFFAEEKYLELLDDVRVIRLLGSRDNAALVIRLQGRRTATPGLKAEVQLGSPSVVPAEWLRNDPVAVLYRLWQLPTTSSTYSMWHCMDTSDLQTYAMIDASGSFKEVPAVIKRIVTEHPAWPAISFMRSMSVDAACRLLCDIIDPRWYYHSVHPTRLTRLYAHLGLTPRNMACCVGVSSKQPHNFERAATALQVWYNQDTPRDMLKLQPEDYLLRILMQHKDDLAKGLLRATQRLVSLVSAVWLDAVSAPDSQFKFDAKLFFNTSVEAAAFEQHLNEFRKLV